MHVLWHYGVNTGRLTENEFVGVTSANSAKIFNMYPRKGSISLGADADLVIWDPTRERRISKDTHHQKLDINLFEGTTVLGVNVITISRGHVVYQDGELKTTPGEGRFIRRPPFAPFYESFKRRHAMSQPTATKRLLS
jgi:dihydropyrimidinase